MDRRRFAFVARTVFPVLLALSAAVLVGAMSLIAAGCGSPSAALPDGQHFGYIYAADGNGLVFDPAEWYGGDQAGQAAVEDGAIKQASDLSDPFYIRNPKVDKIQLTTGPSATFILLVIPSGRDSPEEADAITLEQFLQHAKGEDQGKTRLGDSYFTGFPQAPLPATVVIEHGKVIQAVEKYIP